MLKFLVGLRGVHPPEKKNTKDCSAVVLNSFKKIQIPLSMNLGAPCSCLVEVGDEVFVGQKIGDSDSYVSAPIHSSVSGKVVSIKKIVGSSGTLVDAVNIDSDELYTIHPSITPPVITSKETFISALRNCGLVGLGGAAFPTHVKLNPPKGKEPDVLVINAAECEPYITSDYRNCIDHPDGIIDGIIHLQKWLSIYSAVIGIEDNKRDCVKRLQYHIDNKGMRDYISIKVLKTRYPQGAEKPLIFSTIGRIVPSGGLPHDVKTLVLNVSTVLFISDYLRTGMPLIRKLITCDGGALKEKCNVNVPIGAMISDILESIGSLKEDALKVIMGGPMMGIAIDRMDLGIIKATNAILFLSSKESYMPEEYPCIRCSRCVDVCPMKLLPTTLDFLTKNTDTEGLVKHNIVDCIECGCCSYVCPSNRYLVQSIKAGKALIRSIPKKQEAK